MRNHRVPLPAPLPEPVPPSRWRRWLAAIDPLLGLAVAAAVAAWLWLDPCVYTPLGPRHVHRMSGPHHLCERVGADGLIHCVVLWGETEALPDDLQSYVRERERHRKELADAP